ncbi:hypothetical protein D9611_002494 [Ephemerocybe angulata]|uniref:20S-pre-rRNA D-site endonuclease NOB1 n=1 Tax=Ephemerocybe angulata TaxID=980116 RepID=A0A8H5FEC9_9AGAR|nr:hypothetical protein D9611_002494 [Tulosesus angulatus]
MPETQPPKCRNLVLDAGPLLSLSPLRGLAEKYLTTPQVLAELKDARAREHFEKLGLMSGVKVEVRTPTPASLTQVIQWSKKTGDYAALSHADICVIALTHTLAEEAKQLKEQEEADLKTEEACPSTVIASSSQAGPTSADATVDEVAKDLEGASLEDSQPSTEEQSPSQDESTQDEDAVEEKDLEPLSVELTPIKDDDAEGSTPQPEPTSSNTPEEAPTEGPTLVYEDPSDEDDGEGEWITPENVALHKSRALDLLPDEGKGRKKKDEFVEAGCMTADFAMQNVLLQMGLSLVGMEGKRIERVKTWVLRCHACFKICKDVSKKFCPSCGNNTLLRASVTLSSPTASSNTPAMQIHLKPNFQYRLRGTKYSIPAPKAGTAKTGAGTGLILREDQVEYMRAKKMADGKREREEAKMTRGILSKGMERGVHAGVSSWMDPDWMPEIISAAPSGKGRTMRNSRMDGDLPQIGYGRKNPNERRHRK